MGYWPGSPSYGTLFMGTGSDFITTTQTSVGLRQEGTGWDTAYYTKRRVAAGKLLSRAVSPFLNKNMGGSGKHHKSCSPCS